jgi:hypothetical protein
MSTAAGKRWMGRVAALGCVACSILCLGEINAEVHHIREGRIARSDWLVIPLCPAHHRQSSEASIHLAKPTLMRRLGIASEFDLLAIVLEQLGGPRR